MKLLQIIIFLISCLNYSNGFYIYLTNSTPQCFYNQVYIDEQLLLEISTPIISVTQEIYLTVRNSGEIVFKRSVINQAKIVVPRGSHVIQNKKAEK